MFILTGLILSLTFGAPAEAVVVTCACCLVGDALTGV
jgi:hypothetical protein